MYVTDTLSNPYQDAKPLGQLYRDIAESRKKANEVKKNESVIVVLGNPPYREKAKGRGGWIESGKPHVPPLDDWRPPADWGLGAHTKHLRNLYVYFWRWATWKVFDAAAGGGDRGIVCFITVAGFLRGPGFERMREYLRQKSSEIWVIDASPDGHQAPVSSRIFQGVQHPVCIVLACRAPGTLATEPAVVRYRELPTGDRSKKFAALAEISVDDESWSSCPNDWRAPFVPPGGAAWEDFLSVHEDLFVYSGAGVMPGRTWVIAPDRATLVRRWEKLQAATGETKETLFHPHLKGDGMGDRHLKKTIVRGLHGHAHRTISVDADNGTLIAPVRYAFRTLDRQWIVPDIRLINRPNPSLWQSMSDRQVFLTLPHRRRPGAGSAVSVCSIIPDMDHFDGRGGIAVPLWLDDAHERPNTHPGLLAAYAEELGREITPEELFAYVVALTSHRGYVQRFNHELRTPGLRVPMTASSSLFATAAAIGSRICWLYTFGERYAEPAEGRPRSKPRLPDDRAPRVPSGGSIPSTEAGMPDEMSHDPVARRLLIGSGHVDNVTSEMYEFEVSGKNVLAQWFSARRRSRERPVIGDRRPHSGLSAIQAATWLPEYTTELLDLLHVVGLLVDIEPTQTGLLEQICSGSLVRRSKLQAAHAFTLPDGYPVKPFSAEMKLFG